MRAMGGTEPGHGSADADISGARVMASQAHTPTPLSALPRWRTIGVRPGANNKVFHDLYNDHSHISDPNLRRRMALTEVDKAALGRPHIRVVVLAGLGFLAEAYSISSLVLIAPLLGVSLFEPVADGGRIPWKVDEAIKGGMLGAMIFGQVLFGSLFSNILGRRQCFAVSFFMLFLATLGFALAGPSVAIPPASVLIFWRVVIGIGAGSVYPLSAAVTAEFAPTRWRGAVVTVAFSFRCLGSLLAAVVSLVVFAAFKSPLRHLSLANAPAVSVVSVVSACAADNDCRVAADRAWRIIAALGAVPALLGLCWRMMLPESPRFSFDVRRDVEQADADIRAFVAGEKGEGMPDPTARTRAMELADGGLSIPRASVRECCQFFSEWRCLRVLVAAMLSWFAADFAACTLVLNSNIILHATGYGQGSTFFSKVQTQAVGAVIIATAGALPGCIISILSIDTLGRKPLQAVGFAFLAGLFAALGFATDKLSAGGLLGLLVLIQLILSLGPVASTFLVPAEVFPTRYRTLAHGLSAAFGKVGALAAVLVSGQMLKDPETVTGTETGTGTGDGAEPHCIGSRGREGGACATEVGLDSLFRVIALVTLVGACVSFFVREARGHTLEELGGEPPTSYNSGRHGSISCVIRRRAWWNPLGGGQPAGWAYPRDQRNGRHRIWARGSVRTAARDDDGVTDADFDVDIDATDFEAGREAEAVTGTASPCVSAISSPVPGASGSGTARPTSATAAAAAATAAWSVRGRGGRHGSEVSLATGRGTVMSGGTVRSPSLIGAGTSPTQMPSWGAGWGRIDRGGPQSRRQSMTLRDVGSLLDEPIGSDGEATKDGSGGKSKEGDTENESKLNEAEKKIKPKGRTTVTKPDVVVEEEEGSGKEPRSENCENCERSQKEKQAKDDEDIGGTEARVAVADKITQPPRVSHDDGITKATKDTE